MFISGHFYWNRVVDSMNQSLTARGEEAAL